MIRSIVTVLILLANLSSFSQGIVSVRGEVLNRENSLPIAFAHVYIKDKNFGTISNESGEFNINIDDSLKNENLTISAIGFESFHLSIENSVSSSVQVFLSPTRSVLPEVTIVASKDTIYNFIRKCIKNIRNVYPNNKYAVDAFYREMSLTDTVYSRLIEAAVEIQDNGYDKTDFNRNTLNITGSKIKVIELRKSEDFRTYTALGKVVNFIFGNQNNLYKVLEEDYIRYIGKSTGHFLGKDFLPHYEYELEGITTIDSDPIYIISFKTQPGNLFVRREGKFFINANDHAFVRIENGLVPNDEDVHQYAIDQKYFYKSTVTYSKFKNKYYLNHITAVKYSKGATAIITTDNKTTLQADNLTLMVNNIYTDRKEFDNIKRREKIPEETDLYDQTFKYNPEFWSHYNILLLNPILRKVRTDIERGKDLETQFEKHKND